MSSRTVMWSVMVIFVIAGTFSIVMANLDKLLAFEGEKKVLGFSADKQIKAGNNLTETETIEQAESQIYSIGVYREESTSMCSQNCDQELVGAHQLDRRLAGIDGTNSQEIVLVSGKVIEVEELPTVAGPDSVGVVDTNKIKTKKLKVETFERIDFPKVTISKNELEKYLANQDAVLVLKLRNPFKEDLRVKLGTKGRAQFQEAVLKANNITEVEYTYPSDTNSEKRRRESDDILDLIVINSNVDEENYKIHYYTNIDNSKKPASVYVEKYFELAEIVEEN